MLAETDLTEATYLLVYGYARGDAIQERVLLDVVLRGRSPAEVARECGMTRQNAMGVASRFRAFLAAGVRSGRIRPETMTQSGATS